jgi:type IV secretion system protein VirD4
MTFSRLLKSVVNAPVFAVICVILGMLFSALLLLANFFIHLIGGLEYGQISQLVHAVAK